MFATMKSKSKAHSKPIIKSPQIKHYSSFIWTYSVLCMFQVLVEKKYAFVIVDDYTKFRWVLFYAHKDEALKAFSKFYKRVQNKKGYLI